MGEKSKVVIDKLYFDKLISELKSLSTVCGDQYVKEKLIELNKSLSKINDEQNKISVEERIANKMEEMKGKDSDLNARLYILHQDLKRGKLSEEEALEIFERYVRQKDFDRLVY